MAHQGIEVSPRILAVSDYCALVLGLETLVSSNSPPLEWHGAISEVESLSTVLESGASIIVTDLDSSLGRECVGLLGQSSELSIVALWGCATEDQIDAAVMKGIKGVVQKQAPNDVLLKAIHAVHRGELWLDRLVTSRLLRDLTTGKVQSTGVNNRLTKREQTIYNAVVKQAGAPSRLIAESLHISEHTLRNHLTAIYSKLGVSSRLELLALARDESSAISPDSESDEQRRKFLW